MLKAILEREKLHLRTGLPQGHTGTVGFKLDRENLPGHLYLLSGNDYNAYYLPWAPDTGYYIDLPSAPTGNNPHIFLTANLSGCCVGIQNFDGFIRVRHYNLFTEGDVNPVFSQEDLSRYGTNISWLLPTDKYQRSAARTVNLYTHGGSYADAVIWGEYSARIWPFTSKWHFYYQNGNESKDIYELQYQ